MKKKVLITILTTGLFLGGIPAIANSDAIYEFFSEVTGQSASYDEQSNVITRKYEVRNFETLQDGTVITTDEVITEEFKNVSFRDRFFVKGNSNPHSPEDLEKSQLEHGLTGREDLPWEERTLACDALSTFEKFSDCMWRPWVYGF
jgi:hypothetical protein